MKINNAVNHYRQNLDRYGLKGIQLNAFLTWEFFLKGIGTVANYGCRPLDEDWDVLIIVDGCRADLFREFGPDHQLYEEFSSVQDIYSCASASPEWMRKSFGEAPDEIVSDTAYVCGNGFTHTIDTDRFAHVEEVWRYGRDPELRVTLPEPIVNESIRVARDLKPDRLVVHFEQPHAPFVHCPNKYQSGGDGDGGTQTVWKDLQAGWYSRDEVWQDYGQNLIYVMDYVETLIDDLEGDIVVTSDHGNAIGEWGIYGHPGRVPAPGIKRVPWAEMEGKGKHSYEVKTKDEISSISVDEESILDHLSDLGYRV